MNGQHIRLLSVDSLFERVTNFWPESAKTADENYKKQILKLIQDRLKTLVDLPTMTDYFFAEPIINWSMIEENNQLSKLDKDEIFRLVSTSKEVLEKSEFNAESLQQTLNNLLELTGQKPAILFSLIRLVVSWAPFSPALNETLAAIGKDRTIKRLDAVINCL